MYQHHSEDTFFATASSANCSHEEDTEAMPFPDEVCWGEHCNIILVHEGLPHMICLYSQIQNIQLVHWSALEEMSLSTIRKSGNPQNQIVAIPQTIVLNSHCNPQWLLILMGSKQAAIFEPPLMLNHMAMCIFRQWSWVLFGLPDQGYWTAVSLKYLICHAACQSSFQGRKVLYITPTVYSSGLLVVSVERTLPKSNVLTNMVMSLEWLQWFGLHEWRCYIWEIISIHHLCIKILLMTGNFHSPHRLHCLDGIQVNHVCNIDITIFQQYSIFEHPSTLSKDWLYD